MTFNTDKLLQISSGILVNFHVRMYTKLGSTEIGILETIRHYGPAMLLSQA